jgi:hypothetical protein
MWYHVRAVFSRMCATFCSDAAFYSLIAVYSQLYQAQVTADIGKTLPPSHLWLPTCIPYPEHVRTQFSTFYADTVNLRERAFHAVCRGAFTCEHRALLLHQQTYACDSRRIDPACSTRDLGHPSTVEQCGLDGPPLRGDQQLPCSLRIAGYVGIDDGAHSRASHQYGASLHSQQCGLPCAEALPLELVLRAFPLDLYAIDVRTDLRIPLARLRRTYAVMNCARVYHNQRRCQGHLKMLRIAPQ